MDRESHGYRFIGARQLARKWIYYNRNQKNSSPYSISQYFTLGTAYRNGSQRFKKYDWKWVLVDGEKNQSAYAPCCLSFTTHLQSDRLQTRIPNQGQRSVSTVLWIKNCRRMACAGSHQDRRIQKQAVSRNTENTLVQTAVKLGFGEPREVDFDSTVQEANIAYPSDARLMTKLVGNAGKLVEYIRENFKHLIPEKFRVDFKTIKEKARTYFFLAKNRAIEIKRDVFKILHRQVKREIRPVVDFCEMLTPQQLAKLPWNIRRAFDQIKSDAWRYPLDVGYLARTHTIKAGKILSFHAKELACIKKRETWQRIRIWSSVSTWSYQRELCLCAGIQDGRYERQNQLHTSNRRTCEPVRKWRFKNSSGGQGLLEHEEQEGTYNTRHISGWFAKTITSQGTGYRLETARAPPQPTSGNRATHRTYQTRRTTGAKQNEKRSG